MSDEKEMGAEIVRAQQEFVQRVEQAAGRMRALSLVTVVVALVLAIAYLSQLLLPLTGQTTVVVSLTDPLGVLAELVVLALVVVWLYVGYSDLRFSSRMRSQIKGAREKEKEIQGRMAQLSS
jgi:hypothetical protein